VKIEQTKIKSNNNAIVLNDAIVVRFTVQRKPSKYCPSAMIAITEAVT